MGHLHGRDGARSGTGGRRRCGTVNPAVADVAVITKMIRVMLLAPLLLVLPFLQGGPQNRRLQALAAVVCARLFGRRSAQQPAAP
ncbi:putative sulfate exporter family transporter [Kingella potus]|uniref:putative sulfate exporter family transporter n=1 Tax=Kingella potus TaxID=265175 RepID=UPI003140C0BD